MRLDVAARRRLIADLLLVDPEESTEPTTSATDGSVPASTVTANISNTEEEKSYVDKAEAFVLAHPGGVTTRQVADAIGQPTPAADSTLRQVLRRGTIERRDRLWCPNSHKPSTRARRTIRTMIFEVLDSAGKPLDSSAIWSGVQQLDPQMNRPSWENEMNRLRKEKLIKAIGLIGKNGSGIYQRSEAPKEATEPM